MEIQLIQSKIHSLRGERVMLDFDLAALYEVEARSLNQAVKRNQRRFPEDFMFQLSAEEWETLRSELADTPTNSSQIVMSYSKNRGLRYSPYAFTEQGVAMLSSVLRSEKAIDVNVAIMRAFVLLRRSALTYTEFALKIAELEARMGKELADIREVLRWMGEETPLALLFHIRKPSRAALRWGFVIVEHLQPADEGRFAPFRSGLRLAAPSLLEHRLHLCKVGVGDAGGFERGDIG